MAKRSENSTDKDERFVTTCGKRRIKRKDNAYGLNVANVKLSIELYVYEHAITPLTTKSDKQSFAKSVEIGKFFVSWQRLVISRS